ncbi:unnamed protein product [Soboliphyme baturini]|uniref:Peptidase S1 domain-containing protein n=1 Tax=Soboliphyme baturini TaxID=241478 RepID=A0A183ITH4_9BILA|nr:unnamed protein product [Soboliphyme baturini]
MFAVWLLVLLPDHAQSYVCTHWNRRVYPMTKEIELYLGGMFSIGGADDYGTNADGLWPSMQLALLDVKNHPCVLKGYNLSIEIRDTRVSTLECVSTGIHK